MWINFGRALMLIIWGVLCINILYPFHKPMNVFLNIATIFVVVMHTLQLMLFTTAFKTHSNMNVQFKIRLFLFGVFELLACRKIFL